MKMNNLIAHEIPLEGKHLIEASAGTGKTIYISGMYRSGPFRSVP